MIEDDVQINAAPWSNAHIVAGSMNLYVGAGASLRLEEGMGVSGTRIIALKAIRIGPSTKIGAGCLICDSDMHEIPLGSTNEISTKPIAIGAGVFIGAQSIILKGVEIGDGSVVASGSVLTKPVPPHSLFGGNPAKFLKTIG
jgi:acetyltransferase-like isoleucine patch superfamily enzyme